MSQTEDGNDRAGGGPAEQVRGLAGDSSGSVSEVVPDGCGSPEEVGGLAGDSSVAPSQVVADDWAVIGRLGHARGLRGELLGRANHRAGYYGWVERVRLRLAGGALAGDGRLYEVESIRDYKDGLIYKFREIGTRTEAEAVEQAEVLVKESERPELEAGAYYLSDLLGCRVTERGTDREIGVVVAWQEFGEQMALEVKPAAGDVILIPLVRAICVEIDTASKKIVVELPEGLLELNEGGRQE